MDAQFHGKRALVTGGGRGIGRDIARSLHKNGAKTFVLTKSSSSVESLRGEDPEIDVIQVDLADWDSTRKAVESILPIDLLVNNAGITVQRSFVDCLQSDIDNIFSTNYKAVFNVSQIVARRLVERKKPGAIVNISSVTSRKHFPQTCIYGTSKAAVDSLTKYMAMELGPEQIRVNAVNPTLIETDMMKSLPDYSAFREKVVSEIPLGRPGKTREVSDAVLFLLSDRSSLVNGITMPLDGGHAL